MALLVVLLMGFAAALAVSAGGVDAAARGGLHQLDRPPLGYDSPATAGDPWDAQPAVVPHEDGNHHHMWGWNGGWWIVWPILMVLFWATVIGVVVWAIIQLTRDRAGDRGRPATALDIAKERLARGEISHDEFEQLRRDLS